MYRNFEMYDYEQEIANIIFLWENKLEFKYNTSGSTGKPRGIVHSYETIKKIVYQNIEVNDYSKDSYILNMTLPPTSIGFPTLSILPALVSGAQIKVKKFNTTDFVDDLKHCTHSFILPSVYRVMSKTDKWKNADFNGVKTISSGADMIPTGMPEEVVAKGAGRFHQVYGSTEVPPGVSDSYGEIMGENMNPLIDYYIAEDGELFIKWEFQKYHWASGDIVSMTDKGPTIIGRKKNILKLHCAQLNPETIEKNVLDNTKATKAMLKQLSDRKVCLYYEGESDDDNVRSVLDNWIADEKTLTKTVKRVDEIKVNHMNKLIRTQEFD